MQMKLGHVKLGVSDIKRSMEWYTQVLGFEIDSPEDEPTYYDFKGPGPLSPSVRRSTAGYTTAAAPTSRWRT